MDVYWEFFGLMTKRWFKSVAAFGAALCAVFSWGCRSDAYYHNRAAESAREYLLKEAQELSAEEKYFITFNDPVFLTADIIGDTEYAKETSIEAPVLNTQQIQICISWKLPDSDMWYMVFGTSNARMDFWCPERLIRKKFAMSQIPGLESATELSRNYARDNLFDTMTVVEQNFIRFHFPAVYETNFELNFNPTGRESAEDIEKKRAEAAKSTQYSIVWALPEGKEAAVFCGVGKEEMTGWSINFAGRISEDELRRHTVRIVKTPEEFYRRFPARYAKPTEKKSPATEKK